MLRIAVAVIAVAAPLFAGGFYLQIDAPEANPEAKAKNAAMVVYSTGCLDPTKAQISGVAIRMVNGQKQTTPLNLIPLKDLGKFAVVREWPADASVTLEFVAQNAGALTSMLVRARGDAVEKASAKFYPHQPTQEEEMALAVR